MLVSVIQIGNSRGIRIPKTVLQELKIDKKLELEVSNEKILLKPVQEKSRQNWSQAFMQMHVRKEDRLFIDSILAEEYFEWEWQ